MKHIILSMVAVLALSACVSREDADAKLARGCAAGLEAFLPEGQKIKQVNKNNYTETAEFGPGYRVVTVDYTETDGWADAEKQATCIFAEEFGFLNATHSSNIYQIRIGETVIGKKGNEILGSYEDVLKLTETVDRAMNQ